MCQLAQLHMRQPPLICFSAKQKPVSTNFHGRECQEKPGPPCSTVVPAAELRAAPRHRRVRSEALPVIFCTAAASRGGEGPAGLGASLTIIRLTL